MLTLASERNARADRLASPGNVDPARPAPHASESAGFRLTHLASLDGLRGVACLLVIVFHLGLANRFLPGGYIGVDIFFVLSGFLITTLLLQEWEQTGAIDLKSFFARRALRLMPALITMLLVCWVVALIVLPAAESKKYGIVVLLNLLFQANRMDILGTYAVGILTHTWSLAVEDKFYLLWPVVLCAALTQKPDRRWLVFFTVLGIAACAASRAWLHINARGGPELYFGLDNRADALLMGCLASMLAVWNMLPQGRWFRTALRLSAIISIALLAYACCYAERPALYLYCGVFTLIALAAAICILTLATAPMGWLSWILERRVLVVTGRLSYGLYLWHWPMMAAVFIFEGGICTSNHLGLSMTGAKIFLVAASYLVAAISYYAIERPFLKLRPHRARLERLPVRNANPLLGADQSLGC